jgi:tRNA (guanine37-N1)-methyltransferase
MRIDIVTVLPELLESPFQHSILKRAQDKGLLTVAVHNLRDYGLGRHKQVDDYAFGGGAGMVMMPEPLANCLDDLKRQRDYDEIIYMTPDGQTFNQGLANRLSLKENLLILSGHYKGVDERIREHYVTMEISIGDYVLSGGELAAAVVIDAVARLQEGALNDAESAAQDSFGASDGDPPLLDCPHYTRPVEHPLGQVPEVLLSGNHAEIARWRRQQALGRTWLRRPDLLDETALSPADHALLEAFRRAWTEAQDEPSGDA